MTKVEPSDGLPVKSGEMTNFNALPNSSQMENISTLFGNMRTLLGANQEGNHLLAKQTDLTKIGNPMVRAPNLKYPEDTEVSPADIAPGKQQGGSLPLTNEIRVVWNQSKGGLPFDKSENLRFPSFLLKFFLEVRDVRYLPKDFRCTVIKRHGPRYSLKLIVLNNLA
ncbi:hypothetical protein SESBI_17152 [Sesbania bispinosa]|nr:hypothetical protein SESBI_17152 [Sesbania bispinosa]